MPRYVDGFLLPVPKANLAVYRRLARRAGAIWREHGALAYCECLLDDPGHKGMVPFPKAIRAKRGETVVFSWAVFSSRRHRDRANAAIMSDPRLGLMMKKESPPFDFKRMAYGGFRMIVDL